MKVQKVGGARKLLCKSMVFNGSMAVSKTVGGGSNPSRFAKGISMNIREYIGPISSGLGILGTIAAATIYVNSNFAQAADVEKILSNQSKQIELYTEAQRSNKVFQLEYYDDRLKKLTDEREKAKAQANRPQAQRSVTRSVDEIQTDIDDTKKRREIVRDSIIREK